MLSIGYFLMTNMRKTFQEWLTEIVQKNNIRAIDLSRASGLAPAVVARILSGERYPSVPTLGAIARALVRLAGIAPETTYYHAGLPITYIPPSLGQETDTDQTTTQIASLLSDLPEQERYDILEYTQLRKRIAEQRATYHTRKEKKDVEQ
jgi:transcriptional regulator with XRE-family HTH domain